MNRQWCVMQASIALLTVLFWVGTGCGVSSKDTGCDTGMRVVEELADQFDDEGFDLFSGAQLQEQQDAVHEQEQELTWKDTVIATLQLVMARLTAPVFSLWYKLSIRSRV